TRRWPRSPWSSALAARPATRPCRPSPPRSSHSRCDRAPGPAAGAVRVRILVVGGGGREHAIVRALGRSDSRHELLCTPGNAGIAADARCLDAAGEDVPGVLAAAKTEGVDLVVVGPEAPLVG